MTQCREDVVDDLLAVDAVADPFPYLAVLRERHPVHYSEPLGGWLVTRYEDVQASLRDLRLSSDRIGPWYHGRLDAERQERLESTYRVLSRWMVFNDPPEHTRLRRLVQQAFTPRMIENLRGRVEGVVTSLLDEIRGEGEVDLIQRFAYPLPAIVIAEMLGVPPEDRDTFREWSNEITSLVFGALGVQDRHERAQTALGELTSYFDRLIARRGATGTDVLGALIAAEEAGDALDREEIIATCVLLLFGGHETTTNLIANGTLALLRNPDQLALLRENPERIPGAVEELLRYDGPVKAQVRSVTEDIELRGVQLRAGQRVFLVQAAANRDPDQFPDPDVLDIGRPNANTHVTFGYGIHYCLGAPLARLEAHLAFRSLLTTLPSLELVPQELSWQPVIITRALDRLMVRV